MKGFRILITITQFVFTIIYSNSIAQIMPNDSIIDTYYHTKLKDPYRKLEELENPLVLEWLKQETENSKEILGLIPGRDRIRRLQNKLSKVKQDNVKSIKMALNEELFYLKQDSGSEYFKLYFRKTYSSKEELIYDPQEYKIGNNESYIINFIQPSWDGSKVLISLVKNGSEFAEMRFFDMTARKMLSDNITNSIPTFINPFWLPDNSGIAYLRFQKDSNKKESYLNSEGVIYKFGEEPFPIFSKKLNKNIPIESRDLPSIFIDHPDDKYVLGCVAGVNKYYDTYYTLKNNIYNSNPEWIKLFDKKEQIQTFIQDKDSLVYTTSLDASNFRMCKTSIKEPNFRNPRVLVSEKVDEVIRNFVLVKNGIFYTTNKNGTEAKLYYLSNEGNHEEIRLPFKPGSLKLRQSDKETNNLSILIQGWLNGEQRFVYDFDKKKFISQNLHTENDLNEVQNLMVEETVVKSEDGEEIPLSLIYRKDLKRNKNNTVFLIGYGAYGVSILPRFSTKITSYALEGGIFAVAHVRGGGEKGDLWYQGGYKGTKSNSWKDLISCAEYLIDKKYTAKKKIAIHGASAGGIVVGRAMTERPDLFGAVIISVGILNTVRAETGLNGENNTKEFGSVKDSDGFQNLLKMDSYHHIKKNKGYPATLVEAGMNDTRVSPWHSAKFSAKLKNYNASKEPVLLKMDFNAGHGGNSSRDKAINKNVDILSFAFWKTGHPHYQTKR